MNGRSRTKGTLVAFALTAAFAAAPPARASSIVVLDRNLPPEMRITGTGFEVDEKTGRARLGVDLYDESFEGAQRYEAFEVPGLTFDRARAEVLYEHAGSTVTCAVRKKVLWASSWAETGACPVTVRKESRTADDGSGAHAVTGWIVELKADEPTRSTKLGR
jgi:hypothetical protein